jgi:hypothetical protein
MLSNSGPNSLKSDLEQAKNHHQELVVQLDLDKNDSEKELSVVFRSRVDYRNKEEEQASKLEKLKLEIDGVSKKLVDLNKKNEEKEKELADVKEKAANARSPIVEIEKKSLPLLEKKKTLEAEKKKLNESLNLVKSEADKVQSKFETLENSRNLAIDNFKEEQERLMEVIKKPFNIYFGDIVSVEVANRAPSGKGFFINQGLEDGFRGDMEFITKNENAKSNLPFRLKVSLVQKNFSFLEFLSVDQMDDSSFAEVGDLLRLERSGFSENNGSSNDVSQKIP